MATDETGHGSGHASGELSLDPLFQPIEINGMELHNRIVMPAMARCFGDMGMPSPLYADYYRRRAEGGAALIISEASAIAHPVASPTMIHLWFTEAQLPTWRHFAEVVHAAGGKFMPQIWHSGLLRGPGKEGLVINPELEPLGPSGWAIPLVQPEGIPGSPILRPDQLSEPMTRKDIDDVIAAFGLAARQAKEIGCDGVEIHGAHGYLIDQFLWDAMNFRDDAYGGDIQSRTRFAAEVIAEVRNQVGPDFPVFFRYSQWKQQDYSVRLAHTPQELETLLVPLAEAGVDLFDCSTRRFHEPAFDGSPLTVAGWTRKITGKPTLAVGSVGLRKANWASNEGGQLESSALAPLDPVIEGLERGEFDLVGIGRSIISNPDWANRVQAGGFDTLKPYDNAELMNLV